MSAAPKTAGAMKAVLTDERFSDPDWIFERKLDGIRCVAIRDGGATRMLSRNDLSLNGRYPLIAEALDGQARERFAVDGEVVSASGKFQDHSGPFYFYVFDVQWLDGEDVRGLPPRLPVQRLGDQRVAPVERQVVAREHPGRAPIADGDTADAVQLALEDPVRVGEALVGQHRFHRARRLGCRAHAASLPTGRC